MKSRGWHWTHETHAARLHWTWGWLRRRRRRRSLAPVGTHCRGLALHARRLLLMTRARSLHQLLHLATLARVLIKRAWHARELLPVQAPAVRCVPGLRRRHGRVCCFRDRGGELRDRPGAYCVAMRVEEASPRWWGSKGARGHESGVVSHSDNCQPAHAFTGRGATQVRRSPHTCGERLSRREAVCEHAAVRQCHPQVGRAAGWRARRSVRSCIARSDLCDLVLSTCEALTPLLLAASRAVWGV